MRLAINLIKLAGLIGLAALVLMLNGLVATMHYSGTSEGLTLLRMDTRGLGNDSLLRGLFAGLDGDFSSWMALSITLLIFFATYFAVSMVFRLVRLAAEAPTIIEEGNGRSLFNTVIIVFVRAAFVVSLLAVVLCFDAALFQHRALVGVLGAIDPAESARTVPAVSALDQAQRELSSISLIRGWALTGYIAITVLAAVLLEIVFAQIGETLGMIVAELDEPAERDVIEVSFDEAQNAPALGSSERAPPSGGGALVDAQADDLAQFAQPRAAEALLATALMPVIGGAPGETVDFEQAKRSPDFHVTTHPNAVFDKRTWDALNAHEEDA